MVPVRATLASTKMIQLLPLHRKWTSDSAHNVDKLFHQLSLVESPVTYYMEDACQHYKSLLINKSFIQCGQSNDITAFLYLLLQMSPPPSLRNKILIASVSVIHLSLFRMYVETILLLS